MPKHPLFRSKSYLDTTTVDRAIASTQDPECPVQGSACGRCVGCGACTLSDAFRHSVAESMVPKTTKFPKSRTAERNDHRLRDVGEQIHLRCKITRTATLRVVTNGSVVSDGWPKGVITSYCVDPKTRLALHGLR
jgi:hypothetical protein